ncbi:MAG: magnesium transporter CorA family protein [Rhodovarius sp.]|nr:magnesium transporter CorA family protein [Rhodovarius sp.]MCX7931842.1 magnesium transporter CorA family protein [Rhodovarius sp.]MDW8313505.1 magnesium transporter CorA family protein [Rhodovarius sp.]
MITAYAVENGQLLLRDAIATAEDLAGAVWIDLCNPRPEEAALVQRALAIELPTREEMAEIESSSRLYKEGEALFLTANFLYGIETGDFASAPITFVLTPAALVTVRHATPKAFPTFAARCQRAPGLLASPDAAMLHLFEQIVDRLADILERVGSDLDRASTSAFKAADAKLRATDRGAALRAVLVTLGQVGEITARASETLLGLSRILTFVGAEKASAIRKENQGSIKTLVRDVRSLVEHANFLNNRATFLLDAVLGIINVDQSGIIKTFTVVSVALMPPTLIASIYGMNFEHMPELSWTFGYPLSLLLMVLAAVLPVLYFRRKGWL